MTLSEFRASKREVADMATAIPDECWDASAPLQAGYVYGTHFHIEAINEEWPETARKQGAWYLQIENREYISDNLNRLEQILYDYASSEMGWAYDPDWKLGDD